MIFGDDLSHTRRSLESTVVLTKDLEPVYINYIDGNREINSTFFMKDINENLSLSDLDLCTPYNLGFVNHRGRVLLGLKRPSRQYRAGLNNNNTQILDPFYYKEEISVNTKSFGNTLLNNYPPVSEALNLLDLGLIKGMAISSNYCIIEGSDRLLLCRHKNIVGRVDDGVPKLDHEFSFLKEELEECLNENY